MESGKLKLRFLRFGRNDKGGSSKWNGEKVEMVKRGREWEKGS